MKVMAYKTFIKTMENSKTIIHKVVAVDCKRSSFTTGYSYKALTGKMLVTWMSGRLYCGRWSLTRGGGT